MSAAENKAVFLSYASQDAEAAKRICESLRAAGVEVWFDQNELVGGDAWDAKIKKQIRECALFVPLISASTQVRLEGYFRLEWKLGAQRTHTMAAVKTFLLPIVIDDTHDSEAHVPEEFCAVQWTRLPAGEVTPAFVKRVQTLLGATPSATPAPFASSQSRPPLARPRRRSGGLTLAIAGLVAVAALLVWRPWRQADRPAAPAIASPQPAGVGAEELARVRQRLIPDQWQKEDFAVVSSTLDRVLLANPELADGWALRSIIHSLQTIRQFDRGAKPLEVGKTAADRALRLTPGSPLGELAVGLHLVAMLSRGGDDDAYRTQLDRVLAKLPRDGLTRFTELLSYYHAYDFAGSERSGRAWLAADPKAIFPAWILASTYLANRQADEAERWAEAAVGETNITGIRAHVTQFEVNYYLRADRAKARAALEKVPASGRSVHRVVHAQWLLAMTDQRWDEALQLLMRLPEPMFSDRTYHGPRALLAGLAHRSAGRPVPAAGQFREAERLLRELLANDPDNEPLHAALAVTLACAGRAADARTALGQVEPLVSGRSPSLYRGPLVVMIAQAYREIGDLPATARWLRKLFVEPSDIPFTPASLRIDARFNGVIDAPEIQALLREVGARGAPAVPGGATKTGAIAPARPAAPDKSIAVLPFADLNARQDTEFFAEGMHDEVITHLAKIRDLKVISRTSVLAYRDAAARNVKRVAEELGVAHILEATVLRQGGKVRVSAKLIDAQKDEHLWAGSFTEDLTDVFALQARLAQEIAAALKATLTPGERALINRRPTENAVAYELYLRARIEEDRLSTRSSVGAWEQAAEAYQRALAQDSGLAIAQARLARIHGTLYWFSHLDPSPARRAKAEEALRAAERIAPDAPETHYTRGGFEYFCNNDWRASLVHYDRALAQLPNDAGLLAQKGYAHRRLGEWPEVIACFEGALRLNPADHYTQSQLADHLHNLRWNERAVEVAGRLLAQVPNDSYTKMVQVRAQFAIDGNVPAFLRGLDEVPSAGSDPERLFPRYMRAMLARDFALADELLQRPQPTAVNDLGGIFSEPVTLQRARVAFLAGKRDDARRLAEAALRELEGRAATPRQRAFVRLAAAQAKVFLGRFDEAAPELRAAAEQAAALDAYAGPIAFAEAGRAFIAMGWPDDALAMLREVIRRPSRMSPPEARLDPFWSQLKADPRFEAILAMERPIE